MTRIADVFNPVFRAAHPEYHIQDLVRRWAKSATDMPETAEQARVMIHSALDALSQQTGTQPLLDLSDCGLRTLPPVGILQHLEGITILDLRDNLLMGYELHKLSALTSLRQLYLSNNPLRELPERVLEEQHQLAILELENCQLQVFPVDILSLSRLDTLVLSNNFLDVLPDNLGICLPDLATLDIRKTAVNQLPDSLKYLNKINVLRTEMPC